MAQYLYGRWPVLESLRAGRRPFEQLLVAEGVSEKSTVEAIIAAAQQHDLDVRRVPRRILDDLAKNANHQGVALRAGDYPYAEVDDLLEYAATQDEKPLLLLLDLLQDPQNVGALLRVADAVGVHGVIMQERRNVEITPAVVSASSGAVEHLRVAQVTNLSTTMRELKEREIWLAGLDIGPHMRTLDQVDLDRALGLVLGSEGRGLRRLVRETCDFLITLPMRGHVQSLNVAAAGAVALYGAWQARGWHGWSPPDE